MGEGKKGGHGERGRERARVKRADSKFRGRENTCKKVESKFRTFFL